jgi:hypothetical protein
MYSISSSVLVAKQRYVSLLCVMEKKEDSLVHIIIANLSRGYGASMRLLLGDGLCMSMIRTMEAVTGSELL